ncbi:MAG TPA: Gfo/Idh/MocA family oxidoreductase [Verrucomicrobiales bacterium]|nr:Gfo/Idh/MocA family oxidoreductase [Verrucomicrobiales bacterium]
MDPEPLRAAVIGSTGRGDYGHGLDTVWQDLPGIRLVAVADDNPEGLARARDRLGAPAAYADYGEMLEQERPHLLSIAPRWIDRHAEMILAAAAAGVQGIYMEKPMCRDLEEADAIVEACRKSGTRLAIAFQTRYSPRLEVVDRLLDSGEIGRVLEIHARGKEDARGGGEDLWVLGSHVLNLMHRIAGEPRWCSARVFQEGEPATARHVRDGAEGIGPLTGDHIQAVYGFDAGVTGTFSSVRAAAGDPSRFGLRIHGSQGVIEMGTGYLPQVHLLKESSWSTARNSGAWVSVSSEGPGLSEPLADGSAHAGNAAAVRDLLAAIEENRQPEASVYEGRSAVEMIAAVFESHRLSKPVTFPLSNRKNPLSLLA